MWQKCKEGFNFEGRKKNFDFLLTRIVCLKAIISSFTSLGAKLFEDLQESVEKILASSSYYKTPWRSVWRQ